MTAPSTTDFTALVHTLQASRTYPASSFLSKGALSPNSNLGYYPLEPADKASVTATLVSIRELQDTSKGVIEQLKTLTEFIFTKLRELEDEEARYRSLLAPIHSLPLEILQSIFLIVHSSEIRMASRSPSVVAQVSRHWRQLALSTPELWADINISLHPTRGFDEYLEQVSSSIHRSGVLPLSLTVIKGRPLPSSSPQFPPLAPPVAHVMIDTLISSRLRQLIVGGDVYEMNMFIQTWTRSSSCVLTQLRTVTIRPALATGIIDQSSILNLLGALLHQTPFLERLFLASNINARFQIPLTHLTVFCGSIFGRDLAFLLVHSPLLEVLELERVPESIIRAQQGVHTHGRTPSTLPHLSSLRLGKSQAEVINYLPETLPSLRHLILDLPSGANSIEETISSFLQKHGPQLQYFGLAEIRQIKYLGTLLLSMPCLEGLRGHHDFTTTLSSAELLPQLKHLELDIPSYFARKGGLDPVWQAIQLNLPPNLETITFFLGKGSGHPSDDPWKGLMLSDLITKTFIPPGMHVDIVPFDTGRIQSWCSVRFESPYFDRKGGVFNDLYLD